MEEKKRRIAEAFMRLAEDHPVETIRVSALIADAGVSKATFYRLFRDKYDVMIYACLTVTDPVVAALPELADRDAWDQAMLGHIKANKAYYRSIISYRGQNSFYDFMAAYFLRNCSAYVVRMRGGQKPDEELQFGLEAFANTGAFAVAKWIENGCEQDIKTLRKYVMNCLPPVMQPYYQK